MDLDNINYRKSIQDHDHNKEDNRYFPNFQEKN